MQPGNWRELPRDERIIAHIERIARGNTIMGGASAMVIARRLRAMGGTDLGYVVADVYSASSGRTHQNHGAWECPECGCTHLGQDAAFACCQENDETE